MTHFFLPASKVQKDRHIMRQTDERMVKYSRRGLIVNVLAFLTIIVLSDFYARYTQLTFILTSGLFIATLSRGYFLFRFDALYPRAPGKWRNRYFFVTLLGASWWGFIGASVTWVSGLDAPTPMLWLYTVIFFSTTAHAFAPFQRFLSLYQFLGLIPAALAALALSQLDASIYSVLMLVFFLVLSHQCRLISENYWERLEAAYALARKTVTLEEEKRDTRANTALNHEFMDQLQHEVQSLVERYRSEKDIGDTVETSPSWALEALHTFQTTLEEFNQIQAKQLSLDSEVFNIRHEIQQLVGEVTPFAEAREIYIETSLSPTLPMRLRGDASRIALIIRALLESILHEAERCLVLVEVEFMREYESAGELYVSVTRVFNKSRSLFNTDSPVPAPQQTLSLVAAKGLADLMNGSIELNDTDNVEHEYRFNAKLDLAERICQLDFHKDSFSGRNALLVHQHPRILDIKRQELGALGFEVFTENQYKKALATLENSYKFQKPIENLVFYVDHDTQALMGFCESLLKISEIKDTMKVAVATRDQQELMRRNGYDEGHGFYFVDKPAGLFEFESVFHQHFLGVEEKAQKGRDADDALPKVLMITNSSSALKGVDERLKGLKCEPTVVDIASAKVTDHLSADNTDVIVVDCDTVVDVGGVVSKIRSGEAEENPETFLPVIGVSAKLDQLEHTVYEQGLDDYVDLTHNTKKSFAGTIYYWKSLLSRD